MKMSGPAKSVMSAKRIRRTHPVVNVFLSMNEYSRGLMRSLSPAGRKERQQLLLANPDNWKFQPIYRQLLTPKFLQLRVEQFLRER